MSRKKQVKEKSLAEVLCEPKLAIDILEDSDFTTLHEFTYRQIDQIALMASFDAVLTKQEWLTDTGEGFLPATSRKFSERYLKGVRVREARYGSLFLSIVSGVASGLILLLIQETYKKMHSDSSSSVMQITNNYQNCNISINGNQVSVLPQDSVTRSSLKFDQSSGLYKLDSKQFIEGIIGEVDPGDDLETNITRCIDVLKKENIITVSPVYNSKGVRTVCNYAGRVLDFRV